MFLRTFFDFFFFHPILSRGFPTPLGIGLLLIYLVFDSDLFILKTKNYGIEQQ